ncbi:Hypothetical protein FKW44_017802, partial [Caligus rogercresseyi]
GSKDFLDKIGTSCPASSTAGSYVFDGLSLQKKDRLIQLSNLPAFIFPIIAEKAMLEEDVWL